MNKIKKIKILTIVFILVILVSSICVNAVATIVGSDVTYSNTKSGLTSTDVQGAIDELYEKLDIKKVDKFVAVYDYNETEGASDYCVTGEEETCKRTTCHKTKTANSCKAGTIVLYKVNSITVMPFHVMFDQGSKLIMQSQKSIVTDTEWCSKEDYKEATGSEDDYSKNAIKLGPITALTRLEKATKDWDNVDEQTYSLGTTSFSGKGAYTGCDYGAELACSGNSYTLPSRTAKARLITMQEAVSFGCMLFRNTCPMWMTKFLNTDYMTMNTNGIKNPISPFHIGSQGLVPYGTVDMEFDIRSVIDVYK